MPSPIDKRDLKRWLGETLEDRFELGTPVSAAHGTEVVTARDRQLGRGVTVKRATAGASESDLRRVFVEAQVAAQLEHAHVVPLYSLEIGLDGLPAFTMKRVRGETLGVYLDRCVEAGDPRDGPYGLRLRLEHWLDVSDAVGHAHARSVYHRNLGLDTVSLGPFGEVYVTDWGFARLGTGGGPTSVELSVSPRESAGSLPTDLARMVAPPESGVEIVTSDLPPQSRDEAAEAKDRRALALLLHELVTLAPRRTATEPSARGRNRRRIPAPLKAIVDAALAGQAYGGIAELADDLRRYLRGEAPSVRPDPWTTRATKKIARRPEPYLVTLLAAILAIAGGTIAGRVRSLEAESRGAVRSQQLTQLSAALTDRADQLDATLDEAATELLGVRSMLEVMAPPAIERDAELLLAALARRTNAIRAFLVIDGRLFVIGSEAPELLRVPEVSGGGAVWGDALKRSARDPWVVPVRAAVRGRGVVALDLPLASLTYAVFGHSTPRARTLRLLDRSGRGLDAQGLVPGAIDPDVKARIDAGVESDVLVRDDTALALSRVHALGWYVVGEKDLEP